VLLASSNAVARIAAFVKSLPAMTPADYRARARAPAGDDDPAATHDHSH